MWQEGLDPGYLLRMLPRVERGRHVGIWQNFPFDKFGIPSPFPSQRQGTVAQLFQTPVIWVSAPTSFLTMTLQFLGLVTASFGAERAKLELVAVQNSPGAFPGSPLPSAAGHPCRPSFGQLMETAVGLGGEHISVPEGVGEEVEPAVWAVES